VLDGDLIHARIHVIQQPGSKEGRDPLIHAFQKPFRDRDADERR
jgi:hypothetical protein